MWIFYILLILNTVGFIKLIYDVKRFKMCRKAKKIGVCYHFNNLEWDFVCICCPCEKKFTDEDIKKMKKKIDEFCQ